MKILQRNFRQLFLNQPDSEEKLLKIIKNDIVMTDPKWLQRCKPAPKEDIDRLEKTLVKHFGQGIPPSYWMYLELMGAEDDDWLLQYMGDSSELWDCFKGDNMAQGAVRYIDNIDKTMSREKQPFPDFWNLYYTEYIGYGWGFSPGGKISDQLVQADGWNVCYFTHDTFSKFWLWCIYNKIMEKSWANGTRFDHPICALSDEYQGWHGVRFSVRLAEECKKQENHSFVRFLEQIEEACLIEECWFSSQKEFCLFDAKDTAIDRPYEFARYVGCHMIENMTVSVQMEEVYGGDDSIQIRILSQDASCTKQLVEEILKHTIRIEGTSFMIKCMN